MRLLLIDDDLQLLRLYNKILSNAGYQVNIAATKNTARQLLRRHAFHLVICDVQIGDLSGFDLIEDLMHRDYRDTPVIVISGHHQYEVTANDLDIPFYLKPINKHTLLEAVETHGFHA